MQFGFLRSLSHQWMTSVMTSQTTVMLTPVSERLRTLMRWLQEHTSLVSKSLLIRSTRTHQASMLGLRRAARVVITPRPIGTPGWTQSPRGHHRTTGSPSLLVPPGPGTRDASSTICTTSSARSPILICITRKCRMRCSKRHDSGWIAAWTDSVWMPSITACTMNR